MRKIYTTFLFILFYLFSFSGGTAFAQTFDKVTDEDLAEMPSDSAKMEILSSLAWLIKTKEADKALSYVNEALEIANRLDLPKGKANLTHHKGMVYWYKGDYELASKYFFEALALREELKDKLGLSRSYNNIGNVFFEQENYEQALQYYTLGLEMRKELNDSTGLIYSYNNIADIFLKENNFPEALRNYKTALDLGVRTQHKGGQTFVLQNLGLFYREKNQIDSALYYFNKSFSAAVEIEDKVNISFNLNQIAKIALENRDFNKALELAEQSRKYSTEANAKDKLRDACEILALSNAGLRNYEAAYVEMQNFTELNNELLNESKQKAIIEATSKYQAAKKEAEILNQKTDLLQKEKKVGRLTIFIIVLSFLVALIAGVAFYSRYIKNLQTSKILEEKNIQIEIQNDKLVRSNSALEQFAYIASHDLKEPLRNISSFSTLLERNYKDHLDESGKGYIDIITGGVRHMNVLLDDILTYSRLTQDTLSRNEKIDMNLVLGEVKSTLNQIITDKNVVLSSDDLPVLQSNHIQMYQLLQNLISNGIKFNNNSKPEIHVGYKRENGLHHFSVSDNGIGIKKEYANKIFQIFQRLHKKEDFSGTGIGLAICEKIVKQHGGEIWFESKENKGTSFYFDLEAQN